MSIYALIEKEIYLERKWSKRRVKSEVAVEAIKIGKETKDTIITVVDKVLISGHPPSQTSASKVVKVKYVQPK